MKKSWLVELLTAGHVISMRGTWPNVAREARRWN